MRIREHWPEIVQDILEFRYIDMAEEPEFEVIRNDTSNLTEIVLVSTAPESILTRYEKILSLEVEEDIDVRRSNILNKLSTRTPFTKWWLADKLNTLLGKDNYTLEVHTQKFEIVVEVEMAYGHIFSSVQTQFIKQIPANMLLIPKLKITAPIGVEVLSKSYRFNAPICEYLTGIYPNVSCLGKIDDRNTVITSKIDGYLFEADPTGTKPHISTLGKLDIREMTIEKDIFDYLFNLDLVGTKPYVSTLGKLDNNSTSIDANALEYVFDVSVASIDLHQTGINPDISTLGKIAYEEAQTLETRDVIPFSYKLCNTITCGM